MRRIIGGLLGIATVAVLIVAAPAAGGGRRFAAWLSSVAGTLIHRAEVADGASAVAHKFTNAVALTTTGAKIAAYYPDDGTTEKASIDKDGVVAAVSFVGTVRLALSVSTALGTCSSTNEGSIYRQNGGTTGARTKLCLCTSDGAGTPAYAWKNISISGGTEASTVGTSTTCP